jgi:hypothetical protein
LGFFINGLSLFSSFPRNLVEDFQSNAWRATTNRWLHRRRDIPGLPLTLVTKVLRVAMQFVGSAAAPEQSRAVNFWPHLFS